MADGVLKRPGEPTLRTRLYTPAGIARGSVLLTTGFNEHVGRYDHVCQAWQDAGFFVACWDLRGQGRSEGRRGYVEHFDDFTSDTLAIANEFDHNEAWRALGPAILFGHSTGGLIAIHAALRAPTRFRALLLASPFLGLALPTPAWKKTLGRLMTRMWPTFSQPTNIGAERVTQDAERARALDADPLAVRSMTARLFTEMERAQTEAFEHASEITLPVLCRAAGDDTIADVAATREFIAKLGSPDKTLEVVPGQRHELHQDTRRDEHIRACAEQFIRWTSGNAAAG
jgi:alpha-beta hydrolase superfamily lysophospholipase